MEPRKYKIDDMTFYGYRQVETTGKIMRRQLFILFGILGFIGFLENFTQLFNHR